MWMKWWFACTIVRTPMFVVWFVFFQVSAIFNCVICYIWISTCLCKCKYVSCTKKGTLTPSYSLFSFSLFGSALFYSVHAPIFSPFPFPPHNTWHTFIAESVHTPFIPLPCQSFHLHPCQTPCPEVFFVSDAIIVLLQMIAKAVRVLRNTCATAKLPPNANLT